MAGRAIISGGSIAGLFSAVALQRAGWQVDLHERTPVELAGRGAGIVTHQELIDALGLVGATILDLGVVVDERVAFDIAGEQIQAINYLQIVTSWDRIYQILRPLLSDANHHLGSGVSGYRQDIDSVSVIFEDGHTENADVLIGADGFRSVIRAQMLPDVQPTYSGYVVWRALIQEADLAPSAHKAIFAKFGFFLPTGSQIVGYPIAGPGNDLRPGNRRYNIVWYLPVAGDSLTDMLTDETGRTHALSIPPPLVRDDVLARMMETARNMLPPPFVDMLRDGNRPFFTPIYDHLSPVMSKGRVALVGDAACVARPHVGMGVTKAAQDALALTRHLNQASAEEALQNYSAERVPAARIAYDRSQKLGSYIFTAPKLGDNLDGRSNPHLHAIMRDTAVAGF